MVSDKECGSHRHHGVFSPSRAGHLDSRMRRFLYRPDRLARRYVEQGDRVLDFGCGPGFYTREFAKAVGETGLVVAVDLQEEMLRILQGKLGQEGLLPRIRTHRCAPDSLGLSPELDGGINAAFAIFVVHEVPDPAKIVQRDLGAPRPRWHAFPFGTPVRCQSQGVPEDHFPGRSGGAQAGRDAVLLREQGGGAEEGITVNVHRRVESVKIKNLFLEYDAHQGGIEKRRAISIALLFENIVDLVAPR